MESRVSRIVCSTLAALLVSGGAAAARTREPVVGLADPHLHVTADMRAGGSVISGRAFHPDGIAAALGRDSQVHGPAGALDVTGALLRGGLPPHDTDGWPTFDGWPTYDTNTHQQVYWTWLKRMWRAGQRLVVAQTVEDEPLCEIEALRRRSCDETAAIELQVERLRQLEAYVDERSGGQGRGFIRLVESPGEARQVIGRGKLAVLIGVESSNPFGCSELQGEPQCTRADVDRGIALYRRLGIRSMFVAHWVDNAFAGAALEGGTKGAFINLMNRLHTGHWLRTGPCPLPGQGEEPLSLTAPELYEIAGSFPAVGTLLSEAIPSYPAGPQCNTKGLTELGEYLIRRLIRNRMLIEVDHLSERARAEVMAIARRHRYPLVSSHTGTGGPWTGRELERLQASGGVASVRPAQAPDLVANICDLRRTRSPRYRFAPGLGTDTGGFSTLPGPRSGADPLRYPIRAPSGRRLERQRTGERTFDLNADGVAHYGLFADLLADAARQPGGERAVRTLMRSAESYLRMWERAVRRG
jgi:microsomal dipeptidase-like Zn-dependent dipeptidase